MSNRLPFLSATDKDIFDLLMSDRGRLSEGVLRNFALARGIIYSRRTNRENLASAISRLPHDFHSLTTMVERREYHSKNEKRAYVDIPVALTREEIGEIVRSYKEGVAGEEEVTTQSRRAQDVYVNVAYDEVDYSKTRLIQRQRKDAGIEFVIGESITTIRMPATEKARDIVQKIVDHASKLKLQDLRKNELSLESLSSDQRTTFFMEIMRTIPGYELQTVVSIKCSSRAEETGENLEIDLEQEEVSVESEIVSKINSVALSGVNLLQSEEYQSLRRNGFFITSVTWRALQKEKPQDLLQLDVSFDQPRLGKGFRFGVRIARRLADGGLANDFKPLEPNRQPGLWSLVERTSARVLHDILSPPQNEATSLREGAGA